MVGWLDYENPNFMDNQPPLGFSRLNSIGDCNYEFHWAALENEARDVQYS